MANLGPTVTEKLTKTYAWSTDNFGRFEATVTNGQLTDLRFCKNGSSLDGEVLRTTDMEFLKEVYKALGEFFEYENKKNGGR